MKPYHEHGGVAIYHGDCKTVLAQLEPASVHCCVTSPPYWGLRDYGTAKWEGGSPDCDHFKLAGGTQAQNLGKSPAAMAANVERIMGNYSEGRFAWILRDVRPIVPYIPVRGNRRLWNWTPPGIGFPVEYLRLIS